MISRVFCRSAQSRMISSLGELRFYSEIYTCECKELINFRKFGRVFVPRLRITKPNYSGALNGLSARIPLFQIFCNVNMTRCLKFYCGYVYWNGLHGDIKVRGYRNATAAFFFRIFQKKSTFV